MEETEENINTNYNDNFLLRSYSQNINNVLGDPPRKLLCIGYSVLFFVFCLVIFILMLFNYSESMSGKLIINNPNSEWIISPTSGTIGSFKIKNKDIVHNGDTLYSINTNHWICTTAEARKVIMKPTLLTGVQIEQGDTICVLVDESKEIHTSIMYLPITPIAKTIAKGNKVLISIIEFPVEKYGELEGEVSKVELSSMLHEYIIEISFPNGLITSIGKQLKCEPYLHGNAEIIILKTSILNKLIGKIYKL